MRHPTGPLAPLAFVPALLLALLLALPTWAQDDDEDEDNGPSDQFSRSSLYISGVGIYGIQSFRDEVRKQTFLPFPLVSSGLSVSNSFGAGGKIGYRILPNLAAEVSGNWMNDFQVKFANARLGRANLWDVTGNVKGFLLTGRYQPWVAAGVGYGELTAQGGVIRGDRSGFTTRVAVGADIYADDEIGLTIEGAYNNPVGDLRAYDYFSVGVGLIVRFYGE